MRNILNKILLSDFKSFLKKSFSYLHHDQQFLDNWHLDLISEYLMAVVQSKIKRLIINIPPRFLKSICVSAAWPAWLLAKNPAYKIISASYSQALSTKHNIDCKNIIQSSWYGEAFPRSKIIQGQNSKNKFVTEYGGFRLATSVGGTLTGEGADFLIIDDPLTPMQALSDKFRNRANTWFEQTFASRLNSLKHGRIVIVMQRLHINDLTGFLLKKSHKTWHVLKLPFIAEDDTFIEFGNFSYRRKSGDYLHVGRYNIDDIDGIKNALGSYAFSSQYQQEPLYLEGNIIKNSWLKYYDDQSDFDEIYQSWDCAIKTSYQNDYSVCTTWGIKDSKYYLIDVFRDKLDYPSLKKTVYNKALDIKPNAIIIEDKASGQQILQELTESLNIIKYNPKYDKITRFVLVSSIFEAGKVFIPSNKAWLENFLSELRGFPNVDHDDQIDSMTQFLIWAQNKESKAISYSVRSL